jgi:hypothetical protein
MNFDRYYDAPDQDVPEWVQLGCKSHTARIPHTCEACGQTIQPGERYSALVGVYEYKFVTSKTHFGSCPGWEQDWDEEHGTGTYWWESIQ